MANKTYHRYTSNEDNPMSNWGHAMFADDVEKVKYHSSYGNIAWKFDPTENTKSIEDIADLIADAWNKELENWEDCGYYCGTNGDDITHWLQSGLTADELIATLDPSDIVDSAEAWDCDLGVWFFGTVAEPNKIDAVITQDGAIVWDASLITRDQDNDWDY